MFLKFNPASYAALVKRAQYVLDKEELNDDNLAAWLDELMTVWYERSSSRSFVMLVLDNIILTPITDVVLI